MPFSIGFGELVVIGVVALIVIGPKDLPQMFRTVGRFTGRMRAMADDFRRTLESAADEAGVNDIRGDFDDFKDYAKNSSGIDEANKTIRDINSTRVDEIDSDASELEADLAESEIVDKEIEAAKSKRAAEANEGKAKTASSSSAKGKASAKKTSTKTPTGAKGQKSTAKKTATAKKPAGQTPSNKEKA